VGSFPTEVGGFKPDFWKMNACVKKIDYCARKGKY
jgi:hypothetical protein